RAAKTIKDLLPKFDNWVDEFAWTADSKALLYVSGVHGRSPIFLVETSGRSSIVLDSGELANLHALPESKIIATQVIVDRPNEAVLVSYTLVWPKICAGICPDIEAKLKTVTSLNETLL